MKVWEDNIPEWAGLKVVATCAINLFTYLNNAASVDIASHAISPLTVLNSNVDFIKLAA